MVSYNGIMVYKVLESQSKSTDILVESDSGER